MSVVNVAVQGGLNPSMAVGRAEVRALAHEVLEALGMDGAELGLTLVGDREMAGLHRDSMGRTGPTNTLAFEDEDPERPAYLGEVVLSVDTLARECDFYGQVPREHQARLMAHAFLHLAGMDHGPEMDELTEAAVDAVAATAALTDPDAVAPDGPDADAAAEVAADIAAFAEAMADEAAEDTDR